MPDATKSYWPAQFPVARESVVTGLLKQQADGLTLATKGVVEGVVKESAQEGTAFTSLYAAVPSAGDDQFKIFSVGCRVIADPDDPFPVTVRDSFAARERDIPDMESFEADLRTLLSSAPVTTAISNLIRYGRRS